MVRVAWSLGAYALGSLLPLGYFALYITLAEDYGGDVIPVWFYASLLGLTGWLVLAIPTIFFLHKSRPNLPLPAALPIGAILGWLTFLCHQAIWLGFDWPLVYHVYSLLAGAAAGPIYLAGIRRLETQRIANS
jgi:hypothetical protein